MSALGATNRLTSFVQEQSKYRTLRPQFTIALVAGLILSLNLGAVYAIMWPTEARNVYGGIALVLMILCVAIPFIFWFLQAVLVFLITRMLGARADFSVLFRTTGWGLLPFIGTAASLSAGRWIVLTREYADVCANTDIICNMGSLVQVDQQLDGIFMVMGQVTSHSTFVAAYLLAMAFLVLTAFFWVIAIERTSTLTRAGAAVAVSVPTIAFVVLLTYATF